MDNQTSSTTSEIQTKKLPFQSMLIGGLMILVILLTVIIIFLMNSDSEPEKSAEDSIVENSQSYTNTPIEENTSVVSESITWSFNGIDWTSSQTPPDCSEILNLNSPTDLSTATNILYPGQYRGGDFKPHGGVRYDNSLTNQIGVKLPMDAVLWRGSRYIEAGEVQYMLDFIVPCGIMFRFDHLLTLSEEFSLVIEQLPQAQPDDSRTHFFIPKLFSAGTLIATEIGHKLPTKNVAYDFGVYDLRKANDASKDPSFRNEHANEAETAYFATCWLDLLTPDQKTIAKSLPGPGTEGKTSAYCNHE